jgi:bifunctional pyridoxal-dependent enzyme with beta-cystathionase and maltose regulon repressor activities
LQRELGNGKDFGEGGEMHMRVNLATQRDKLAEAMNRMKAWLETL